MTILFFVIILTILVVVHEIGHFFAARKLGVAVDEFGVGFPPRAFGLRRGKTLYSVNWVPLGGFVKIKGEQGDHAAETDSFSSKSASKRTLILASGVLMNILLAWVLLSAGYMIGSPSVVSEISSRAEVSARYVQVVQVEEDSPASQHGLSAGDRIVSLDGNAIDTVDQFRASVASASDRKIAVRFLTGGEEREELMSPTTSTDGTPIIGVGLAEIGTVRYPFFFALWEGIKSTGTILWQILVALYTVLRDLVVGQSVSLDLAGPVGIAVLTGQVAKLGIVYLIQFAALLSLNLAIINILPFPALDGGRILFILIEKIRKKPVTARVESIIHTVGFAVLITLVLVITVKDISKFSGQLSSFFDRIF